MIVVDASVLLEVLLNTPAAERVATRLFESRETLHAPHLLDLEVAQVLRRYCLTARLRADQAQGSLEVLEALPILRHRHDDLLDRIWELRHNFTAYDAAYLALAESLGAVLLTRDAALASTNRHRARVELL